MGLYRQGRAEGDFESGIRLALQAILASPRFLFRLELAPADILLRGPAAEHGLLLTRIDAEGRLLDVTRAAAYVSSHPGVAAVDAAGRLRAVADGEAEIRATHEDLGAAVTVITEDEIREKNYATIEEALRHVPGVEVKGATLTELEVSHEGALWRARTVVDV